MKRYLIYDTEIANMPLLPNGKPNWTAFDQMELSVLCWETQDGSGGHFFKSDLQLFWAMYADHVDTLLIGFNSKSFDDKLVKANGLNQFFETDYDLLEEVRIAAYGSPNWQSCPKGFSYSLGKIAEANGYQKTGSGELAPIWWQQGLKAKVVQYCAQDTRITHELLKLGLDGKLIDPNTKKLLKLRPLP